MIILQPAVIIDFGPDPIVAPASLITVSTQNLNLPINCVIAGQQPEEKDTPKFVTDPYGILKKIIFGE